MTSRYRVEYALKVHRRDEFIEWIKGLLAAPFVLHAVHTSQISSGENAKLSDDAKRRYSEVFSDIEKLIIDHIAMNNTGSTEFSRLKQLVPSVGLFFTPLPLCRAFKIQDERRSISMRRLVSPSFNDIRLILNTAQIMALSSPNRSLELVTFDGDVTLYEDGYSLTEDANVISRIIHLLKRGLYIGVVTAAGYSDPSGERYYERLKGLVDAIKTRDDLPVPLKENFLVMGGESNFLFRYNDKIQNLVNIDPKEWMSDSMASWDPVDVSNTLEIAESHLNNLKKTLNLQSQVIRKDRAVGIVPSPGHTLCREQLEEVVLSCQKKLDRSPSAQKIKFCAFNGGSDVWVDIGDKALGVESLQNYLGGIEKKRTLHVGDQFAALGANDYKARLSACTVWIANPEETVVALDDLIRLIDTEQGWNTSL